MKSKGDKVDVDKLLPVPVNFKEVSDVIGNGVVKKTEWNELINFNVVDTSKLVKKEIKIIK